MFIAPFFLVYCFFQIWPLIYTFILSFQGNQANNGQWVGLDNYSTILFGEGMAAGAADLRGEFLQSLGNTFILWFGNFIPQILLSLLLAVWFTDATVKLPGKGFFKVVMYMPNIITAATVAVLFGALIGYPMGPMNDLFTSLGLSKEPIFFFQNKWIAKGVVSFIQFWMWYGYTMIVLISGILGISPELYEAAEIDGATTFKKFLYITLPNLRTILIFTLITSMIGGLTMFDIPKLLVQQSGPNNATLTTSVFIYNQAFSGSYMYNRASAASMIMFIIIGALSAVVFFLMQDKSEIAERKELKRVAKEMKKQAKEGK